MLCRSFDCPAAGLHTWEESGIFVHHENLSSIVFSAKRPNRLIPEGRPEQTQGRNEASDHKGISGEE
jgi:hypothetical protein